MNSRPVVLCILDGLGIGAGGTDDAVATARTPTLDRLKQGPKLRLKAHGTAVGLPSDADMGNSEVGHNAMGAGRVFDQGASLVNQAFASGAIFATDAWRAMTEGGTLHLLGLVSDGNVHSHVDHLNALIDGAVRDGVRRLRVHALTDGRDVAGRSALVWLAPLEAKLAALPIDAAVASGGGRMRITMDRYGADWEMVRRGWATHVHGEGRPFPSACAAVEAMYAEDPTVDDQNLDAFVITDEHGPKGVIRDGDAVLLFNFRGDRAIEISQAFEDDVFPHFDRAPRPAVRFAGMMQYDGDLHLPSRFLVAPPRIEGTVGDSLVAAGLTTFAVAETQKFGHVTYFFNGNRSGRLDEALETYVEVPSDVRPFDEAPWMKAAEVADAVIGALRDGRYNHIRVNFANPDMVGHTGNLEATRIAVEAVDLQLGRVLHAADAAGALVLVTADHGNADEMWQHDKKGAPILDDAGVPLPRTSHTLHAVPFYVYDPAGAWQVDTARDGEGIAAIGATVLTALGVEVPEGWVGGLIRRRDEG